jgi:hypothetical protein
LSARHNLADLELELRKLDAAEAGYSDVLTAAREAAIGFVDVYCLAGLAAVAALRGQPALAREFWGRFESLEELRAESDALERDRYVQIVDTLRSDAAFRRGYEAARAAEAFPIEANTRPVKATSSGFSGRWRSEARMGRFHWEVRRLALLV